MKKMITLSVILLTAYASRACYADFTYNNGCVGDTVWFHAGDWNAVYSWDYGDSASGVANVSHDTLGYHVYITPGDYWVTLFVNIGAEWDYRTNLIHIRTDCFAAAFNSVCYGNLQINFSDFTIGAHNYQAWDFGDPASGTNDTSTFTFPSHNFTVTGNYTVTYIVSDGTQWDTATQIVHVDSLCLFATIPNVTAAMNCAGDSLTIYAYYSSNVSYHVWNFGDPGSGANNTSTDSVPIHVFSAPGFYIVTLIYGDGITFDTVLKAIPVIDCNVWPGDCNEDGEVNCEDIFPLGLYYGHTGNQRMGATTNWSGQSCPSWSRTGFAWMYLQDLVDMKNADCNGDSTVNELDISAIQSNYGLRHYTRNNRSSMLNHHPTDATLAVQVSGGTVTAGNDITATIMLGTSLIPANNVYGGSFTLLYDQTQVDPNAIVAFNLNWFDTSGHSLITIYHETYSAGKLEVAFVKTDHQNHSGYGVVATIVFHTKSTAGGVFNISLDGTAKLFSSGMFGSGNLENFQDMYLQDAAVTIQNNTGISNINTDEKISLFPNPSAGLFSIYHEKLKESVQMELFNDLGEKIFAKTLSASPQTETVRLPEIAAGLYTVSFKSETGMIENKKLVITR